MLRIAICDDDKKLLTLLHKEIDLWFLMLRKTDYNFSIDEYTSSEQFSFCLKSNSYDIIFLDIEMPKLNGIELAKQIRSKLPDVILIFLTSHNEFAPQGYKVKALRYLSKLNMREHFLRRLPNLRKSILGAYLLSITET